MIIVDQALCAGCGACVDACLAGAITLRNDVALVDADRCDGCRECITACPNQALAWIAEPSLEAIAEPVSLAAVQAPTEMVHIEAPKPVRWRRTILPVVGGALSWAGRELVPRLAPLALDALEGALDRQLSRRTGHDRARPIVTARESGQGRQRRFRHRRRHRQA